MVDTAAGQALADEYKIKFFETSAKNNINVEPAIFTLATDIKKRLFDGSSPNANQNNETFQIDNSQSKGDKSGCPC